MKFMRSLYLIVIAVVLTALACADPAANKPKAQTTEPTTTNTVSSPSDLKSSGTALAITPENSKIEFTGSKVTGKHDGGFKSFKGIIDLVGDKAEASKVAVEIEMASVFADVDKLTTHLQTADFFEIEKYPRATFASTKIEPATGGGHTVTGDLELRGVKKSVTFPATITIKPDAVEVRAEFSINRKDFGIAYAGKADDLIGDDVVIRLDLNSPRKK